MIHFWLSLLLYVYFKCLSIIIIQFEKFPRHQFKLCWLMIVVASLFFHFFSETVVIIFLLFRKIKAFFLKVFRAMLTASICSRSFLLSGAANLKIKMFAAVVVVGVIKALINAIILILVLKS